MDEIRKIPIVTRSVIGGVLAGTLPVLAGILPIYPLVFIPQRVTRDWQLWRLLTSFCFGGKGLAFVFDLFMMYRGLNDLEESHFRRRTADMVWALVLMCSGLLTVNLPLKTPILYRPLLMAVTHLWAQNNPTNQVSLFGFINIRAPLFPFALLGLDFLQYGPSAVLVGFTGIAVAHAYYFAKVIYPRQSGGAEPSILSPPQFLVNLLGNGEPAAPGGGRGYGGSLFRSLGGRGGQRLGSAPAPAGAAGGIRATAATPSAPAGSAAGTGTARAGTGTTTATAQSNSAGSGHRWGRGNRLSDD